MGFGLSRHPAWAAQFLKFLFVGVLNTAVQFSAFLLLYGFGHMHYLLASGVGYGLGMLNSYLLNRHWTFGSANVALPEILRFTVVNLIALALNLALMYCLVTNDWLQPRSAQLVAIGASIAVNFALNRAWTFAPRTHATTR